VVTGNNKGRGGATVLPTQTNLALTVCAIDQGCAATLLMHSSGELYTF